MRNQSSKLTPAMRQAEEQKLLKNIKESKQLMIDELENLFSMQGSASILTDFNKLLNHYTTNPLDGVHDGSELSNIVFTYTQVMEVLVKADEQLRRQSHFEMQIQQLKIEGSITL